MNNPLLDSSFQLVELYALYGFSFFLLFVAVVLQPRVDRALPFAADVWLLGAFAFFHGLREFVEAWTLLYGSIAPKLIWLDASLLLLACVSLFEFGRRMIGFVDGDARHPVRAARVGVWIYLPLGLAVFAMGFAADDFVAGFRAGSRFFFGFSGAIAGGVGLWRHATDRNWAASGLSQKALRAAAVALVIYGGGGGLVFRPDPAFPAWIPTTEDFLRVFGFPVQGLRMACAFVMAPALLVVTREAALAARRRESFAVEEVARLNKTLVQRVRENTAELEGANRQLIAEVQERKKVEEELRENQKLLDNIANSSPALIRVSGIDRACTNLNQGWVGFTGMNMPQALGRGWLDAVHPDDVAGYLQAQASAYAAMAPFEMEYRLRRYDGNYRWMLEQGKPRYDAYGEFAGFIGSCLDITDRKQGEARFVEALEQLRQSEQRQRELTDTAQRDQGRLRSLLSAMNIGILFEDRDHQVEYVNPAFLRMWAIEEGFSAVGSYTREIVLRSRRRVVHPEPSSEVILRAHYPLEFSERAEVGFEDGCILTQASYPVTDAEGRLIGRLWLYEDITRERQTAEQLRYLAERDPLTGLFNRHRFDEHLRTLVAGSFPTDKRFALIYFDLDEFKFINDNFGHKAGDTVLVRIAGEVGTLIRSRDVFARLGGDEFAVLTTLLPEDDPTALPRRILNAIVGIPFRFGDASLRISGSVGVAIYPEHGTNAEDLVAHADTAMYQAKSNGKNTLAVFDPQSELVEAMVERLSWSRRISDALRADAFLLHFQGVYELSTNRLHHLEALVRMRDPHAPNTLIQPGRFLPAAEQSGLVGQIDRWVVATVVDSLSRNPELAPVSVNISGRTLVDPAFPQFIRAKLGERGVDPSRLIIELGEVAVISDSYVAQRFIDAVNQTGCRVCLENFGSGLSSFAHLRNFPADILKIDGVFIRELPDNPANQILIKAIVDASQGLGKSLVAEFVEDAATLEIVRRLGVPLAQGYHLGRPAEQRI